jgi:hypothetical protein
MSMAPAWVQLDSEALEVVSGAEEAGVTLRVVGSGGIRLHCAGPGEAMDRLGRPAKDIDFIVPKDDRKGMRRLLESRGYVVDRNLLVAMEGMRYSFAHPENKIEIDVFVERLQFNHTIEVRGRLDRHRFTIALEELLLQKLQIVNLTVTDILDLSVLLSTHPVAPEPAGVEEIDAAHIASLLAKDWGFHHTAVRNLQRVREAAGAAVDMGHEVNESIRERVDLLLHVIENRPKTMAWRMRAKVGERMQWWEDVDDREATY